MRAGNGLTMRTRVRVAVVIPVTAGILLFSLACKGPTADPEPPSGGRDFVLSYDDFVTKVEPVLVERGCSATGDCHGGGIRGSYALSPVSNKNPEYDFNQTVLQVDPYDMEASPLLTKPLASEWGGSPHNHEPFADTSDPGYQAILAWIQSGEFEE